jgi:hypothetical protein
MVEDVVLNRLDLGDALLPIDFVRRAFLLEALSATSGTAVPRLCREEWFTLGHYFIFFNVLARLHRFWFVLDKLPCAQNWLMDLPAAFAARVKDPGCEIAL